MSSRIIVAFLIMLAVALPVHPAEDSAPAEAGEPAVEAVPASEEAASEEAASEETAGEKEAGKNKGEAASEDEPSLDERLDAILAETLSDDEYRETRRCLFRHEYRSVDIINQEYLLFRRGNTYWLNKLRHRCIALRGDMVLSFNPRGSSSTCEGDQVYVTSRFDLDRGFTPSGVPLASQGSCILGQFEQISVEQAALLREAR